MKKLFKKFFVVLIAFLSFGLAACDGIKPTPTPTPEPAENDLAKPEGLKYEDGQISWTAVQNASNGYKVVVKAGETEVISKEVKTTSISVEELEAGSYKVLVNALAVTGSYKASPVAELAFTVEEEVVEPTELATPASFAYNSAEQVVTWGTVEGAVSYKVSAVKTGTELTVIEEQVLDTTSISVNNLPAKEITIKVQALVAATDTLHKDSAVASYDLTIAANKLATPAELKVEKDVLSFAEVANSDCYLIQIFAADNLDTPVKELVDTIETSLSVEDLGQGNYVAKVIAYAELDSIYYEDSEVASLEFTIASLGELVAPEIAGIKGGYITWAANTARSYEIEIVKRGTEEKVSIEGLEVENNSFMLAGLEVEDGDYTFRIKALSNRHDTTESAVSTYDFTLATAKAFDAAAIATFNGTVLANNWGGEHGKAELVEVDGVQYGLVTPTADGWGRVASPQFTVNFNNNPVLFLEMGSIFGGFHVQMTYDGTLYSVLNDTMKEGNIALSLLGVKTESGVVLNTSGIQTIALRLGVDNSTTTTANDAKAHYHAVKVVYLTEYKEPENVEVQLATPEKLGISEVGTLSWSGVENATHYAVEIVKKGTTDVVYEQEVDNTSVIGYNLEQGDYTINVKAINKANSLFLDSEVISYNFTVTQVVKYAGAEMSTFICGGGDNPQIVLNADNTITLNPNGAVGWGWVWDPTGVTIDLDKNPLIIVNIEKSNVGGYLARATYNGTGTIVMANDTPGAFDTTKTLVFRASKNVDGNPQGSGVVEGYKFGIGVRGNGEIVVSTIRILTITEYKEAVSEQVTLATPANLGVTNNAEIKWDSVTDATAYKVSVSNAEGVVEEISTIRSVYSVAHLPVGVYTISVSATNAENELILDSEAATFKFQITEAISYSAEELGQAEMGDGDGGDVRAEYDAENDLALYNPDRRGWGWLFPKVGATVDMSLNPFIVTTIAYAENGYLARAKYDGNDNVVMINDTRNKIESETFIVLRANVNVDGNPVSNEIVENYKFGFGFLGGIVAISNIRIIYVTPVVE